MLYQIIHQQTYQGSIPKRPKLLVHWNYGCLVLIHGYWLDSRGRVLFLFDVSHWTYKQFVFERDWEVGKPLVPLLWIGRWSQRNNINDMHYLAFIVMIVADDLVPYRHQSICNHQDDLTAAMLCQMTHHQTYGGLWPKRPKLLAHWDYACLAVIHGYWLDRRDRVLFLFDVNTVSLYDTAGGWKC